MTAATPPDLRWMSDLGIESDKFFKFALTPPLPRQQPPLLNPKAEELQIKSVI
jgi:hypothetical protein